MLPPLHNFPAGIADGCGGPLMGPQVPFCLGFGVVFVTCFEIFVGA